MSNVVNFPTPPPGNRSCPKCGNEWFTLRSPSNAPGAIVIDAETNEVTGYYGIPHCMTCDTPLPGG